MVSDSSSVLNKTAGRNFTISFLDYFIPIKNFLCLPNVYCILYLILCKWRIYNDFHVCSEMTGKSRAHSKVVANRKCKFFDTKKDNSKGKNRYGW